MLLNDTKSLSFFANLPKPFSPRFINPHSRLKNKKYKTGPIFFKISIEMPLLHPWANSNDIVPTWKPVHLPCRSRSVLVPPDSHERSTPSWKPRCRCRTYTKYSWSWKFRGVDLVYLYARLVRIKYESLRYLKDVSLLVLIWGKSRCGKYTSALCVPRSDQIFWSLRVFKFLYGCSQEVTT